MNDTAPSMRFRSFHHESPRSFARRLIDQHARWLSRALSSRRRYPQIPVRKVSEGGFARLMQTREGRKIAQGWWYHTLEELD